MQVPDGVAADLGGNLVLVEKRPARLGPALMKKTGCVSENGIQVSTKQGSAEQG